jgi:transforming growth factor-beta-induced protein
MNRTATKAIAIITLITTLGLSAITASTSHAESSDWNKKQEMKMRDKVKKLNIVQTAASQELLSTLVSLIKTAGLVDALSGKGPFTVFAPCNRAFNQLAKDPKNPALVEAAVASLVANPTQLAEILKYHVVVGNYPASSLKNNMKLKTLNGATLTVKRYTNGKVKLMSDSGSPIALVTTPDVMTKNGTVHVIDQVLIPKGKKDMPKPMEPKDPKPMDPMPKPPMTGNPDNISTLMKLVEQSGLAGAFETGKKYTVLAPTNRAFANLSSNPNDEGLVEKDMAALVANKDLLRKVLSNHVFDGVVRFEDLKDGQVLYNILGDAIQVRRSGDNVELFDTTSGKTAKVEARNVETPYGILHVVSEVILP